MSNPRSNSTTNPAVAAQRGQEACAMLHRRSFLIGALAASVGGIPAYADALADETIHARWLAPALQHVPAGVNRDSQDARDRRV